MDDLSIQHIETIYAEHLDILKYLNNLGQISLAISLRNLFAKSLAIAAASYFEDYLKKTVDECLAERASNDALVRRFIFKLAVERQYHTWFDWNTRSAAKFFSFFDEKTQKKCKAAVEADDLLAKSIVDFVAIGSIRNEIVHKNMINFAFLDTPEEVMSKVKNSLKFLSFCRVFLGKPEPANL